jgi:Diacylglycerol kinase catalytic domain
MNPGIKGAGRPKNRLHHFLYLLAGLALVVAVATNAGDIDPVGFILPSSFLGIAVLTNVEAGKNRCGRYKSYGIPQIVGDNGLVVETETMEEIDGAIERILSKKERLICLNGGDGTVQRALSHLMNNFAEDEEKIPILYPLRGGTMNLLADHLKIKGTTPELLQRALATARSGGELPFMEVPTLRVVRETAGVQEKEYGFFFGNGALYRFHRIYYRETNGGPLAAAGLFVKCVFGGATKRTHYKDIFGVTPAKVVIDDFEMPADEVTVVLALIFKAVVLTFDAFRDVGGGDFYVLATSVPIFKLARSLPKILWAKGAEPPYPEEIFYNRKAKRVSIQCREGYSLDGEVFELEEPYNVTIDLGPKVKILQP